MNSGSVYYLRIAVKDKLGNISVGANYFSYRYWYISPPATRTASTYNDYTQGINSNLDLLTTADTMKIEKNNNGSWSLGDTKSLPASISGGASAWANGSLYVLRGNGTKTFWRYDPDGQVWNNLVDAPDTINNGSSMTWDRGDNLFVLRGNNTSSFYRYNLVTNVWYAMGNASVNAVAGADLKYGGNNKLFALYTSGEFYSYEITGGGTGGVWTYLNQAPFAINCSGTDGGAGLYFNGGDEIFAYFGSDGCAGKGFAKYTISQSYWTQLSKPPYQFYYMHQNLTGDGLGNLYIFGQDNVRKGRGLAQKYNILSDSWSEIESDYVISHRGTISSDEKRYIYILPGTGTNQRMLKYDFLENRFTPPGFKLPSLESTRDEASSIWIGGNASSIAYDNSNNVYLMGANEGGGAIIAKYNLVSGNYEYLPGPPLVGYGGTLRFSNNYIYYLPARSTREFYRYNLGSRQWERMADTPNTIYRPGPMTLIADTAGNLYALRGNDTAFYKYTPDSGLGVWSSLQATPGSVLNGSAVYSDEGANQYIYLIRGNGTSNVYRYSIGGNTWSTMTSLPTTTSYGNTLLINNNKLYVTAGNATSNAYVFDISSPGLGWVTGPTAPQINNVGSAMIQVDTDKAFGISGYNSPNLWQFVFPSSTKSYNGKGSHISPSIQINGIFDYASLKANGTIPAGTKVEF